MNLKLCVCRWDVDDSILVFPSVSPNLEYVIHMSISVGGCLCAVRQDSVAGSRVVPRPLWWRNSRFQKRWLTSKQPDAAVSPEVRHYSMFCTFFHWAVFKDPNLIRMSRTVWELLIRHYTEFVDTPVLEIFIYSYTCEVHELEGTSVTNMLWLSCNYFVCVL